MVVIKIAILYLLKILILALVVKSLMTWFPGGTENKLYYFLENLTSPIEAPIRRALYRFNTGPVDFSSLIAFFMLIFIERMIMVFL